MLPNFFNSSFDNLGVSVLLPSEALVKFFEKTTILSPIKVYF